MTHVHLLNVLSPTELLDLAALRAHLDPGVKVTSGLALPEPASFDVLVAGRPTLQQLQASPNLRLLVVPFAGLPDDIRRLLVDPANGLGHVAVHNLHHNTVQTAEMALALLLAAARLLVPNDQALRRGDWTLRYDPPQLTILHGKTILILGYGAIGQHVGRVCQALGMNVLAVRRRPAAPTPTGLEVATHSVNALSSLLPQADVLMVTLPLTDETRGLIGADQLALLPDGALLVNVGRGPVVDEAALYQALHDGRLAAAGLDVWYRYPESETARTHTLPSAYPFHELDNVVLSPHSGGGFGSPYTEQERMLHLARLVNAVYRGEPAPNRVDLNLGY
ncbi:MAG TPA: 2-hydroxyacid dehydrogenase [Anaerolineae bacterium]|nr:2-hydroxyacid dehydrogenase [Anaerolineae bacterium]